MNELDKRIAGWRKSMNRAGMKSSVELDELESHLREEISALIASGMGEGQAFDMAISSLGKPDTVGEEFIKLRGRRKLTHAKLVAFRRYALVISFLAVIPMTPEAVIQLELYGALLVAYEMGVWTLGYRERARFKEIA